MNKPIQIKKQKLIFFVMTTLISTILTFNANGVQQLLGKDITDPSISTRCQNLLKKREIKIEHRQKLWSLINRNKTIEKSISANRNSLKNRLVLNYSALQREYNYTTNRIELLTKTVVKSGCPGLKF